MEMQVMMVKKSLLDTEHPQLQTRGLDINHPHTNSSISVLSRWQVEKLEIGAESVRNGR